MLQSALLAYWSLDSLIRAAEIQKQNKMTSLAAVGGSLPEAKWAGMGFFGSDLL